jgi:hypothetical protein
VISCPESRDIYLPGTEKISSLRQIVKKLQVLTKEFPDDFSVNIDFL